MYRIITYSICYILLQMYLSFFYTYIMQHVIELAEIWVWWARLAKRCKLCSNAMDTFASFA